MQTTISAREGKSLAEEGTFGNNLNNHECSNYNNNDKDNNCNNFWLHVSGFQLYQWHTQNTRLQDILVS